MALYKETITLRRELLNRVNSLLSIEDLNNLTEEEKLLQPKTDEIINVASVVFDNGNIIDIEVCSGIFNYYDNCVLKDKEGYEILSFDCSYYIDNEIEFECENDTYIVYIEVQEENVTKDETAKHLEYNELILGGIGKSACTEFQSKHITYKK